MPKTSSASAGRVVAPSSVCASTCARGTEATDRLHPSSITCRSTGGLAANLKVRYGTFVCSRRLSMTLSKMKVDPNSSRPTRGTGGVREVAFSIQSHVEQVIRVERPAGCHQALQPGFVFE